MADSPSRVPSDNLGEESSSRERKPDDAPHSRLFVVCGRTLTAEDLKPVFSPFGNIKELFIVMDRATGESKGSCFVLYEKTSSAALAQEELNNKPVCDEPRPLRVLIAEAKGKHLGYDVNDEKSRNRLFVVLPKTAEEDDLKSAFSHFDGYETGYVVRDTQTNTPKGFGYVKFARASQAAIAMENCDETFRCLIAEPKDAPRDRGSSHSSRPGPSHGNGRSADVDSMAYPPQRGHDAGNATRLYVIVASSVTSDQLATLCDLAPGMERCELKFKHGTQESRGFAFVTYDSSVSARFAKERLGSVEYPPGTKLVVKYAVEHPKATAAAQDAAAPSHGRTSSYHDLPAERHRSTPWPATSYSYDAEPRTASRPAPAVDSHSYDGGHRDSGEMRHHGSEYRFSSRPAESYSSPSRSAPAVDPYYSDSQSRTSSSAEVSDRLFFVFTPSPPPDRVVKDLFGRYGHLLDAYTVRDHNYGYAQFSDERAAMSALRDLHGREVCGSCLKVVVAKPPRREPDEPSAKRAYM